MTLDLEERNSVQDEGENPPPNSDTCESEPDYACYHVERPWMLSFEAFPRHYFFENRNEGEGVCRNNFGEKTFHTVVLYCSTVEVHKKRRPPTTNEPPNSI